MVSKANNNHNNEKLENKCCPWNLWKDEKGYTRCLKPECGRPHVNKAPEEVVKSDLVKFYIAKWGKPNGPGKARPKDAGGNAS